MPEDVCEWAGSVRVREVMMAFGEVEMSISFLRIINGRSFNFTRMNFSHPHKPHSPGATNVQAGKNMREMVYQYRDANG